MARYSKGVSSFGSDTFIKIATNLSISPNQDKSNCFTDGGNSGGLHSDMDLILDNSVCLSYGRSEEAKRLRKQQGIDNFKNKQLDPRFDGKTNCLTSVLKDNLLLIPEATKKGFSEINPGECFDFTNINSKTRGGRKMEKKSNCLMAQQTNFMHYTKDFKIRRLTPREVFRLQTFPEPIIDKILNCGVSDSQLYRQAGNGWTVEVIVHILSYMKIAQNVKACPVM
jgi:site-specific DNA-cytosine methylase